MRVLWAILSAAFTVAAVFVQADEYVVTADSLNVRNLPFVDAEKVGTLRRGDTVQTTISLGYADWIGVELPDGTSGFVSSRYVERVRVDEFNADFLQILPQDNPPFLDTVLSDFHIGLQRAGMVTPSANGRFLVFTPPQDGAYIYDTVIDRTTRQIDTRTMAVTNDFLVYKPVVGGDTGGLVLPSIEVVRLDTTDDIIMIDPKSLGWDRFLGLTPVPDSNMVLTQVDRAGDWRLVLLDVEQRRIVADLGSVKDDHENLDISFYPTGDGHVFAMRFQSYQDVGGVGYVVDLNRRAIMSQTNYPAVMTRSLTDILIQDENVLVMRGDQGFDRDLFTAFDTRTGDILWTRPDSFSGPRLIVNTQGRLIEEIDQFSQNPKAQRINPRTGQNVGGIVAHTSLPDNYERVWSSNDGAVQVTITGEEATGGTVLPGASYRIETQGEAAAEFTTFPAAVTKFVDIARNEDGEEVLRVLLRGIEDSAYYEWPLTAPEPSLALAVDADLEWVSGAIPDRHRVAIFNEPGLYRLHQVFISNFERYASIMLSPKDPSRMNAPNLRNCRAGLEMERIDSFQGRYAKLPDCIVAVGTEETGLIERTRSSQVNTNDMVEYPNNVERTYDCPYNTTQDCTAVSMMFGSGMTMSLDSWDFMSADQMRDGSEVLNLSRLDPANDTLTLVAEIPMARINTEVYRYFTKTEQFGSQQRPEMRNVVGYGPDPAFFIRGTRIGEDADRVWFLEFDRNGVLKTAPRPVGGRTDSIWLGNTIQYNGEVFLIAGGETATVINNDLEIQSQIDFLNPETVANAIVLGDDVVVISTSAFAYKVFSLATGDSLATFFVDADLNAVALLGSGYFAANGPDAAQSLIVRNRETGDALPIQSVFDTLYRPDLVGEALIGDPDRKVAVAADQLSLATVLETGGAPTIVEIDDAQFVSGDSVTITATAQLGASGIGSAIWQVNGVTVGVDASVARAAGSSNGQRMNLVRSLPLEVGKNDISVQLTNHAGTVYSERYVTTIYRTSAGEERAPRLFVLAIGVDDYDDPNLKLNYAVNDARAVTEALERRAGDHYEDVIVRTLYNSDVTSANLSAEFASIAEDIKPSDTFIFFLAGHGVTFDGRYYFLPPNINVQANPATALATYGVSQTEWRQLFSQISAMKSLILFDSCESGSAIRMEAARSLEQGAGISRLAQATGRAIITAAAETQVALEGYEGHGAFTHTILDAFLNGDDNDDDVLNLTELADHLVAVLPAITQEKWSYSQDPQVFIEGTPFDIGGVLD